DVASQFATPGMTTQIRLGDLLGFFYNLAIACGLICQLPLVTMTLTAMGLDAEDAAPPVALRDRGCLRRDGGDHAGRRRHGADRHGRPDGGALFPERRALVPGRAAPRVG